MYSTDMLYAGGVQGHRANKLLAALEPQDFACLEPHLEIVNLQHGQVLCEAGQPLHYAYFPHNVIISLMAVMHDGRSAEMSVFGSEGVTGLTGAAVTNQAFGRYVVQLTGTASRIKIAKTARGDQHTPQHPAPDAPLHGGPYGARSPECRLQRNP